MALLFPFLVMILFDLIILAVLKGVVFACITKRIYLWDQLMCHSFFSVCNVKWPCKVKKVMSLLSIDLQVNQQLNYQTPYLALISSLVINLTWQLIVVFILPCILIVIMKLFIVNLFCDWISSSLWTFSLGLQLCKSKCNSQSTWSSWLELFIL